ncbi:MAG TPA: 4'-phosphopantetheinyl transferase superfamily protein, partial [Polyangiales bacterium]|nr:4'-phosphopantetheinyl transferase superfamily protein [Polyangiales bacterium]
MNASESATYLSKLLNREVTPDMYVTLTSGQRARFLSWLENTGIDTDLPRTQIVATKPFTLRQLAGSPGVMAATAFVPAAQPPVDVIAADVTGVSGGVGIDIQRIAEIVPFPDAYDFRSSAELAEIFTQREISYACSRPSPTETLAGLFAAKEAIMKADAAKASAKLREIEILP